ncbi:MAG: hypothetical protein PQ612_07175 [Rickettsiales bacterium]|nr:hypothetical protein [Pseudomonadota bacterium]MDA0965752.1 hypothetical protein [Pseudomonadota bacterium]MDG4543786.1 hypothetical protein [Rickettsiales bacterium]MDG4545933.1 hypothetical protein [Rickettsiales bacterium]MDG4548179.1 hypothetical protein [Rickettsiales bacterium]
MTHPEVLFEYNKLHSCEVSKQKPKPMILRQKNEPVQLNIENLKNSDLTAKESDFDQFVDIESPDYDKSIYEKGGEVSMKEAHSSLSKLKNRIDYSYAENYAPQLAKRYWQELEDERREIESWQHSER